MTATLERGLGGRKEIRILIAIVAIGAMAVLLAWLFRRQVAAPPIVFTSVSRDAMVKQGPVARGSSRVALYTSGDKVRLVPPAVGRDRNHDWRELPDNSILQVTGIEPDTQSEWIECRTDGSSRPESLTVHASFLKSYVPVELDRTTELADVRFINVTGKPGGPVLVAGSLRNISSRKLAKWVVLCLFYDRNNQEIDMQRALIDSLAPNEIVDFRTSPTDRRFARVTVQLTHATPDGLRNYLSAVEINHGNE